MNPDEEKTIKRLTQAVEQTYSSSGKMFWRGLMWGLGKGIGNIIGILVLLAILWYLFQASGLANSFKNLSGDFEKIMDTLGKLSGAGQALPR